MLSALLDSTQGCLAGYGRMIKGQQHGGQGGRKYSWATATSCAGTVPPYASLAEQIIN